jgi:hypothetical protein
VLDKRCRRSECGLGTKRGLELDGRANRPHSIGPPARRDRVAVWHMLQTGETYLDPGGDYYTRRDPARTTRRLVTQLERLGHTVTLQPAPAMT